MTTPNRAHRAPCDRAGKPRRSARTTNPSFTIAPDQLPALLAFPRVAAHGSFTHAARELEVSPSALDELRTRNQARVRLLNRATRRADLTAAGVALFARVEAAVADIDTIVGNVREQERRQNSERTVR